MATTEDLRPGTARRRASKPPNRPKTPRTRAPEPAPPKPVPAHRAPPPPPKRALDVVALLGLVSAALLVSVALVELLVVGKPGKDLVDVVSWSAGAAGLALAMGGAAWLDRERGASATALMRALRDLWQDPSADWMPFVGGCALALPLIGLHSSVLRGDADSARLIAQVQYVRRNGLFYLVQTQDSALPHLVFRPLLDLGGIAAARAYAVASVIALHGTVGWLSWRLTRSPLATLTSVVALASLPAVIQRAYVLPMYPTMLALGYAGGFLAHRAMSTTGRRRWLCALLSAGCLVAGSEAQAVGQLFFAAPMLIWLFVHRSRSAFDGLVRCYVLLVVLAIPRIVVNLWEGGFTRFRTNRSDYWVSKGYIPLINGEFWGHPTQIDPLSYVVNLPQPLLLKVVGLAGIAALLLAMAAALFSRGRLRWLGLACLAFMLAAVIIKRVPIYPRYFSPLMPGLAMASGAGAMLLRRRGRPARWFAAVCIAGVLVSTGVSYTRAVWSNQFKEKVILQSPHPRLAERVGHDEGVIGTRSPELLFVDPDVRTFGGLFLTEEEFVTYLTWPSDGQVLRILAAHDIGWVLVVDRRNVEVGYHNTWVIPNHGDNVRHLEHLADSPNFCRSLEWSGYILYKVGRCQPLHG